MNNSNLDILERGLRGHYIDDLVEGWSFQIAEVSSNVYRIDGIDKQGHHVSRIGVDPKTVISDCIEAATKIDSAKNLRTKIADLISNFLSTVRNKRG
jgi:hypothetical protein